MKKENIIPQIAKDIARLYNKDGWKFKNIRKVSNNITAPKLTADFYKDDIFYGTLVSRDGLKDISFSGPKGDEIDDKLLETFTKAHWLKDTSIDELFRKYGGVRYTLIQMLWIKGLQYVKPGSALICFSRTKNGGMGRKPYSIWYNLEVGALGMDKYDFEGAKKSYKEVDLRLELDKIISETTDDFEDFLELFDESPFTKIYDLYKI